ncbi:DUF2613 domain-containing protein [Corynebacterium caspium]|uniref:DUF2613 domain-containing protein n=1 Tax=Corynebacterium caspium TaxID=234828 RepID=UPI00036C6478|nr:DUF2613 domain-containing protein [Corynebacterium caspium]WKD59953.1 hypothetical protein CCASP_07890 [Corynebacterium caspium DSM 44850]
MAWTSDSLLRRTSGPALASAVVGTVIGIIAVLGIANFTDNATPAGQAVPAEEAVLGGPEYGSRG